ncbi:MAG: rhamnogalacturonan acetylesterase [Lachnospiraceae bacterium]|nr:rhamnogalacturonan acetylesterase [Lachnospiraceae bacterium]
MKRLVYIGDSTVTFNKISTWPQCGLSQGLMLYLKDDVYLRSFAVNGRSTKSFIDQGRLDTVDAYLEKDDLMLIQFGHNDAKESDPARYAPVDVYHENLRKMIRVAKKHEALPVVISPLTRRYFDEHGVFTPGCHTGYPAAARQAAADEGVPFIDLTAVTEKYVASIGEIASRSLFVFPKDNTHLVMEGAVVFAGFIADGLKNLGHPYVDFLCAHDAKGTDEDGREAIDPYMTLGMAADTSALTGMKATEYLNETED